ncbi:MAG TPA: trypsin-like peptidase domain-containing protein [Gemmatimonadales bacterium]|nr:trypsin-like peptidase domain-containing protein [Gemmatimonadales bacterium]
MPASLSSFSDQLADAVTRAAGAVVSVHARPRLPSSGVHWRDGVVVTTDGTVRRDQDLSVTLPDGRRSPAQLAGRDPGTDLAVLRIATGELPVATPGDPAGLRPGHLVLAIGRTGDGGPRAAFGAISATGGKWRCWKGGEIDLWIQSDLTIYPGLGGGPLISPDAGVLGINSGGLSRPLATTIPVATVERVLDQILAKGYVARGWLGAAMQPVRISDTTRARAAMTRDGGLVILSVEPDAPAALAGLMVGDVIVAIDGHPVQQSDQVLALLAGDTVGRTLVVELIRGGKPERVEVLVGERPRTRR